MIRLPFGTRPVGARFPRLPVMGAGVAVTGMLTAAGFAPAAPTTQTLPPGQATANCLLPPASCYAPHQFRVAYGIQPLLDHRIDGRGQTVVLLEQASPPPASPPAVTDIRQDLARFDDVFRLPAARLRIVTTLAGSAAPWLAGGEEVEDTEIVHAVAPGAAIRIVLVPVTATSSAANFAAALTAGLRVSLSQGSVISISASVGEHYLAPAAVSRLNSVLRAARDHRVTVTAASGDSGAASDPLPGTAPVKEVSLPASDPLVLAVGGTSLTADHVTGAYIGETAWNTFPGQPGQESSASGGGFSHLFARPGYQDGVAGTGITRGVPDVAADASARTGMAVAIVEGGPKYALTEATGTSAGPPLWAGLVALGNQFAGRALGFVNADIYRIARSTHYHQAFHDITAGSNTMRFPAGTIQGYPAAPGWDPVTGWGTPDAQVLIPLLAHPGRPSGGR